MKRKFLIIAAAFAMAICSLGLFACGGEEENDGKWIDGEGGFGYRIDNLDYRFDKEKQGYYVKWDQFSERICDGDDIVIKSQVHGKPVVGIEEKGFWHDSYADDYTSLGYVKSIGCLTIPTSVVEIGEYAFNTEISTVKYEGDIAEWCNVNGLNNLMYGLCNINKLVINGNEVASEVVIPDGVEEIASGAFYKRENITSVKLPDSVKVVGSYAFTGCWQLSEIALPSGLQSIGNSAFWATALTELIIPNSVTDIGDYAFSGCWQLSQLNIPSGVTSIGEEAFSGCSSLTNITMPDSVTSIGERAFDRCPIETATIPATAIWSISNPDLKTVIINGGTSIMDSAFSGCTGLTSITLSDGVTSIGERAFLGCTGLTSIALPNSVTSIGSEAFCGCSGLQNISFAEDSRLTDIGGSTFYNCSSLTSITIPNGVKVINGNTFSGCTGLTSIEIPNGVTEIVGYDAFDGCPIETATLPSTVLWRIPRSNLKTVTINGGTSIENGAFNNCESLTNITILEGVTSVEREAFSGCAGLQNISFAEDSQLTDIGDSAFHNCSSLTSITIPDSVTSIGWNAFNGCSGLTSITIPDSVTSIGRDAFAGCGKLQYNEYDNAVYLGNVTNKYVALIKAKNTSITSCAIHDDTKIVYYSAFYNCSSLASITIPGSVIRIGVSGFITFYGCSSLTSITVNENNANYASQDGILYNKAKTEFIQIPKAIKGEINIPEGITHIGQTEFQYGTEITSIVIPDSVTDIASGAFSSCISLTSITVDENNANYASQDGILYNKAKTQFIDIPRAIKGAVTIPSGVTSIGEHAFSCCTELTSITIPDSVTSIEAGAFKGLSNLVELTVPFVGTTSVGTTTLASAALKVLGAMFGIESYTGATEVEQVYAQSGDTGLSATYYIPQTLRRVTVRGETFHNIEFGAFSNCTMLTDITVENAHDIKAYAFYNCTGISEFTVNKKVSLVDGFAFNGCTSLGTLIIEGYDFDETDPPAATDARPMMIRNGAFKNCASLTQVTIPDRVVSMGANIFEGCTLLVGVTMEETEWLSGTSEHDLTDYLFSTDPAENVAKINGDFVTIVNKKYYEQSNK